MRLIDLLYDSHTTIELRTDGEDFYASIPVLLVSRRRVPSGLRPDMYMSLSGIGRTPGRAIENLCEKLSEVVFTIKTRPLNPEVSEDINV